MGLIRRIEADIPGPPWLDPEDFRSVFDAHPEAQLIWDPFDDRVVEVNAAACRLLGCERDQLIGSAPSRLFRGQLGALTVFTQAVLAQHRGWTDELRAFGGAHELVPVECIAGRIVLHQRECLLVCLRDQAAERQYRLASHANEYVRRGLSEWQRVARLFAEIEEGNQLILSAAGEGIYGVNAEGVTTFVNPAAERMLGWRAEELVGRNMHTVVHHSRPGGEPYPSKQCPIFAAFRDGAVHRVEDEVFWRKDGTSFAVEYTSTPIHDGGRLIGAVVLFRDISDRKQAEEQLRQAVSELEALKRRLEMENAYLQEEIRVEHNHDQIVGRSQAIRRVIQQIELVAPTDAAVLITGESGTGKELIARAIHESSHRCERPFIRVNCAAVPRDLFESEFFGHEKGSFTGAVRDRAGRFELADGGTLLLDEVGEIPVELQGKLLRVLQEGEFERVGGDRTHKVNVRIIAATNRDLPDEVAAGRFREDLYFRLNVFPIRSVALRERIEDVPLLASHFLAQAARRFGRDGLRLTQGDAQRLQAYDWPGNVRELENVIERAVIISLGDHLMLDLPVSERARPAAAEAPTREDGPAIITESERRARDRAVIEQALGAAGGKVFGPGGAAEILGVKPTTLTSRIKRLGIHRQRRGG
jgi:formate hydrogenlyase transcriptional activator